MIQNRLEPRSTRLRSGRSSQKRKTARRPKPCCSDLDGNYGRTVMIRDKGYEIKN